MPIELDHTIIAARDAESSARWFAELFGLGQPHHLGHFWQVTSDNGVALDFASGTDAIAMQHYAFLVSDDEFDQIYARIVDRDLEHWADPTQQCPQQINHDHGGRGVYFFSNDGHYLEILTRSYSSPR